MKNAFFIFILLLAASVSAEAASKVEFYFFINADNDLVSVDEEGNAVHQGEVLFKMLEKAGRSTTENSALHVFIDPNTMVSGKGFDQSRAIDCTGGVCVENLEIAGSIETDLTDVSILDRFLSSKVFESAEETKRVLVYWGHGNDWKKIKSFDFSASEKNFSLIEYKDVIAKNSIDLLVFDSCLMASLEVAAAFKNAVKFIAASPYELPVEGLNWSFLASLLSSKEELGEQKIFEALFTATAQSYLENGSRLALLLIDLSGFDAFISEFSAVFKIVPTRFMAENQVSVSRYLRALDADAGMLKKIIVDGIGPLAMALPEKQNVKNFLSNQDVQDFLASDTSNALPNWNSIRIQPEEMK